MARKRARRVRPGGSEPGGEVAIETHRLTKAYGDLVAVESYTGFGYRRGESGSGA